MFGKKKKRSASIRRESIPDFIRRPEYEALRAEQYRLYPGLEKQNLLPLLDAHLTALFRGEVDDANGDMLDSIIFAPAREAVPELMLQRLDHGDALRRLIARRVADREDFGRMLADRRQELAELEQEYGRLCRGEGSEAQ